MSGELFFYNVDFINPCSERVDLPYVNACWQFVSLQFLTVLIATAVAAVAVPLVHPAVIPMLPVFLPCPSRAILTSPYS